MTSPQDKIRLILALSKEIKLFLADRTKTISPDNAIDAEVLIYTLFNVLNEKVKNGVIPKERLEQVVAASLNQYIQNSNLDLYIQKLDYPPRFDHN